MAAVTTMRRRRLEQDREDELLKRFEDFNTPPDKYRTALSKHERYITRRSFLNLDPFKKGMIPESKVLTWFRMVGLKTEVPIEHPTDPRKKRQLYEEVADAIVVLRRENRLTSYHGITLQELRFLLVHSRDVKTKADKIKKKKDRKDFAQKVEDSFIKGFLTYAIFLSLFLSYTLLWRQEEDFYVANQLESRFGLTDESFQDMTQIEDVWPWLETSFLPALFDPNQLGITSEDSSYAIVGGLNLRTVRVVDTCEVPAPFNNVATKCYSSFSASSEDFGAFGVNPNIDGFTYQTETTGNPVQGTFAPYPESGYSPSSWGGTLQANLQKINQMKENGWIDRHTRAVIIETTLYNANRDVTNLCSATIIIEQSETGKVLGSSEFITAPLFMYKNSTGATVLAFQGVFAAFLIYYFVMEALEIWRAWGDLWTKYLYDRWNMFELINYGLFIAAMGIELHVLLQMMSLEDAIQAIERGTEEYFNTRINFRTYADLLRLAYTINAINAFFTWTKVLKFFRWSARLSLLGNTLTEAMPNIASFSAIFAIIYGGACHSFVLAFGTELENYRTFSTAAGTLFRAVLGDFDYTEISENGVPYVGALLFVFFMVLVSFVLLNMFIAIVTDAYANANAKSSNDLSYLLELIKDKARESVRWVMCSRRSSAVEPDASYANMHAMSTVQYQDIEGAKGLGNEDEDELTDAETTDDENNELTKEDKQKLLKMSDDIEEMKKLLNVLLLKSKELAQK